MLASSSTRVYGMLLTERLIAEIRNFKSAKALRIYSVEVLRLHYCAFFLGSTSTTYHTRFQNVLDAKGLRRLEFRISISRSAIRSIQSCLFHSKRIGRTRNNDRENAVYHSIGPEDWSKRSLDIGETVLRINRGASVRFHEISLCMLPSTQR